MQHQPVTLDGFDSLSHDLEAFALRAIEAQLGDRHPLVVLFSAGKDSSVLANLALTAAANVAARGEPALVIVSHADVGVENPEIHDLAEAELRKMAAFAKARGVALEVRIVRPALADSFAVRVIGGRALPAFPDSRRDCTTDWKRRPAERALAALQHELTARGWNPPVVMTGVRRDESTVRSGLIRQRREEAGRRWTDAQGRLRLSPLLDWTSDDVWTYLGLCRAGVVPAYSDFDETMRVYQAAGGSSCVVVADAQMQKHSKPCASRFGCWACTAVQEDRSLHQMIDGEPERYAYMRPLAALRDFISRTQYDWSRRHYLGRTITDGFVTVAADGYSPAMLDELLRYALSIQADTGVEIVSAAHLVAIDSRWSQYALAAPHAALAIWRAVEDGRRWYPPAVKPVPKTPVPRLGLIHVGDDWNDDAAAEFAVTGLRSPMQELFAESCGAGLRTLSNGRAVMDLEADPEISEDDAWLFLDFESERWLAERSDRGYWTAGYERYLALGLVRPAPRSSRKADEILRRSQWRQRADLHGQRDPVALRERLAVRFPQQAELFTLDDPASRT